MRPRGGAQNVSSCRGATIVAYSYASFQVPSAERSQTYGVKLDVFEGPLDLLLYLIKKHEIDIYDIPVASITREFMDYVEIIELLDLEQAGDFLVMAATLMKIKSEMLLPATEDAEDDEQLDPREELVSRLVEYQRYKETAAWLGLRHEEEQDVFYRSGGAQSNEQDECPVLARISLFDLLSAFKKAMDRSSETATYMISEDSAVSVDDRIGFILQALARRKCVAFSEVVGGANRVVLIVTFLAVLEVVRRGSVVLRQLEDFGDIWLYGRGPDGEKWFLPA